MCMLRLRARGGSGWHDRSHCRGQGGHNESRPAHCRGAAGPRSSDGNAAAVCRGFRLWNGVCAGPGQWSCTGRVSVVVCACVSICLYACIHALQRQSFAHTGVTVTWAADQWSLIDNPGVWFWQLLWRLKVKVFSLSSYIIHFNPVPKKCTQTADVVSYYMKFVRFAVLQPWQ